jgi:hypothetical protein
MQRRFLNGWNSKAQGAAIFVERGLPEYSGKVYRTAIPVAAAYLMEIYSGALHLKIVPAYAILQL